VAEQRRVETIPETGQQIETVLVIDDDADWCFIARLILQKAGVGKKIITANNGQEGIKTLQTMAANNEKLPELIFLDIKMPVMDGFEFLDELTKAAELDISQTRIFVCSSSSHPRDKERAALYPVAGFLTKPLTKEVIVDILN